MLLVLSGLTSMLWWRCYYQTSEINDISLLKSDIDYLVDVLLSSNLGFKSYLVFYFQCSGECAVVIKSQQ